MDVYPFDGSDNGSLGEIQLIAEVKDATHGESGDPQAQPEPREPSVDYNFDEDYENVSPGPAPHHVDEPSPDPADILPVGHDHDTPAPPEEPVLLQSDHVEEPSPDPVAADISPVGYDYDTPAPPKEPVLFQAVPQEDGNPGDPSPQIIIPPAPRPSLADEEPLNAGKTVSFAGATVVGQSTVDGGSADTSSDGGECSSSYDSDVTDPPYRNI